MGHRAHGDVHEVGLQDHCEGCAEIAEDPFSRADSVLLRNLAALAIDRDRLGKLRSTNEGVAAAQILTTLERVGKLAELAPETVQSYLRERWRLQVRIR